MCTNLHKAVPTLAVTAGDSEIAVKANLPVFTFMSDSCPGTSAVFWECRAADVDLLGWGHWDSVPVGV